MGNTAASLCCLSPRSPTGEAEDGLADNAINKVELAATELFSIPGVGTAFHTSIVVNGEEFFFSDSGIFSDRVLTSHNGSPHELRQLGFSSRTGAQMCQALEAYFMPRTYDLIRKNCNSFSDCALSFLLNMRLDRKYSVLERYGQLISKDMLQRFTDGAYQPNPEAASYSSDTVIAEVSKMDLSNLPSQSSAGPQRAAALCSGKRVTVAGLKKAEHLNGQGAEILRFDPRSGRWEARLFATGEVKAFRDENLRPAGLLVLNAGDLARISGLKSEAGQALNGKECRVIRYDPTTQRYDVQVGDEAKKLKAENLQAV